MVVDKPLPLCDASPAPRRTLEWGRLRSAAASVATTSKPAAVCSRCEGTGLDGDAGEMTELYSKREVSADWDVTGPGVCRHCAGRGVTLPATRLSNAGKALLCGSLAAAVVIAWLA